jgi:hypothetical protein
VVVVASTRTTAFRSSPRRTCERALPVEARKTITSETAAHTSSETRHMKAEKNGAGGGETHVMCKVQAFLQVAPGSMEIGVTVPIDGPQRKWYSRSFESSIL